MVNEDEVEVRGTDGRGEMVLMVDAREMDETENSAVECMVDRRLDDGRARDMVDGDVNAVCDDDAEGGSREHVMGDLLILELTTEARFASLRTSADLIEATEGFGPRSPFLSELEENEVTETGERSPEG